MLAETIKVDATFENGVLRPDQPLPLSQNQRVHLLVQPNDLVEMWPKETSSIYAELAAEDRQLALNMEKNIKATWPVFEEQA